MRDSYDAIYLDSVTKHIGNMLQKAVLNYGYDGGEFLDLFLKSGIGEQIEIGNPKYVAGYSGEELVAEVIKYVKGEDIEPTNARITEITEIYWVGWILAYYQWYSGRSFHDILEKISYKELLGKYDVLHEADVQKVWDVLDANMV